MTYGQPGISIYPNISIDPIKRLFPFNIADYGGLLILGLCAVGAWIIISQRNWMNNPDESYIAGVSILGLTILHTARILLENLVHSLKYGIVMDSWGPQLSVGLPLIGLGALIHLYGLRMYDGASPADVRIN